MQRVSCVKCQFRVFPHEKIELKGFTYHKPCLVCKMCSTLLDAQSCSMIENETFCYPHYRKECRRLGIGVEKLTKVNTSENSYVKRIVQQRTDLDKKTTSDVCFACNGVLEKQRNVVLVHLFHPTCSVCVYPDCGSTVDDTNARIFEGKLYCEYHAVSTRNGTMKKDHGRSASSINDNGEHKAILEDPNFDLLLGDLDEEYGSRKCGDTPPKGVKDNQSKESQQTSSAPKQKKVISDETSEETAVDSAGKDDENVDDISDKKSDDKEKANDGEQESDDVSASESGKKAAASQLSRLLDTDKCCHEGAEVLVLSDAEDEELYEHLKESVAYTENMTKTSHCEMVLAEILNTEKSYVQDLSDVINGYLVPLKEKGKLLSETEINQLFGNIEELAAFHKDLYTELITVGNDLGKLGRCFLVRQEKMEPLYSNYCTNTVHSERYLSTLMETEVWKAEFTTFQQNIGHQLPLSSYLLKPVQRVMKYPLLLKEIIKYNEKLDKITDNDCVRAHNMTQLLAGKVNTSKKNQEHVEEFNKFKNTLIVSKSDGHLEFKENFSNYGKFLRICKVYKLTKNFKNKEKRTLILFTEAVIVCRMDKNEKYSIKDIISIYNINLKETNEFLEIIQNNKKFEFIFVNPSDKNEWYNFLWEYSRVAPSSNFKTQLSDSDSVSDCSSTSTFDGNSPQLAVKKSLSNTSNLSGMVMGDSSSDTSNNNNNLNAAKNNNTNNTTNNNNNNNSNGSSNENNNNNNNNNNNSNNDLNTSTSSLVSRSDNNNNNNNNSNGNISNNNNNNNNNSAKAVDLSLDEGLNDISLDSGSLNGSEDDLAREGKNDGPKRMTNPSKRAFLKNNFNKIKKFSVHGGEEWRNLSSEQIATMKSDVEDLRILQINLKKLAEQQQCSNQRKQSNASTASLPLCPLSSQHNQSANKSKSSLERQSSNSSNYDHSNNNSNETNNTENNNEIGDLTKVEASSRKESDSVVSLSDSNLELDLLNQDNLQQSMILVSKLITNISLRLPSNFKD